MFNKNSKIQKISENRVQVIFSLIALLFIVFAFRLFSLQVLHYTTYKTKALSDQLKQYEIPASRGEIDIQNGDQTVPLVLNQSLYTIYADPSFIKKPAHIAQQISSITGGDKVKYENLLKTKNSRYVVLAKKISGAQKDKIIKLKVPGVGAEEQDYRIYPQGSLASQTLGFVNDSGKGVYGLEQALNNQLSGKPGKVKAVTDSKGIPLAASKDNIQTSPVNGTRVITSLDLAMQSQMEQILADQYKKTKSQNISAVIMDANNGQVKAIANNPTFDPSNYQNIDNIDLFKNNAITEAIEPGSSMKVLTTAAALNMGVVKPDTSFYDPAHWLIDGFNITDIEEDGGARQQDIASILYLSLNTGAVWLLMQMGGGQINQRSVAAWHDYMVKHFNFGQLTNIEQGYESGGYVPRVNFSDPAINLNYANTTFGQGVQVTALQMAAAFSSVVNGGTYYQPTLVDRTISADGTTLVNKPKVLKRDVVSKKVSNQMIPLMQNVVHHYASKGFSYMNFGDSYIVGGKTGTAQIAEPGGGYYPNKYNGTYAGFVGGDKPQYVIAVFNMQPNVPGYAGAFGGQPVFGDLAHMLINDGYVQPKSN